MCGIVAYVGKRQAYPILIKGLQRLEYRGYDSAGVALLNGNLNLFKTKGKVADLQAFTEGKPLEGSLGIGHTRWATHGPPNDSNAHPHYSETKNMTIIHNGIIENYATLKIELESRGRIFHSDTDTEVLVYLIEDIQQTEKCDLLEAVRLALNEVVGAYAIVIIHKDYPNQIIGAKKGSPLVVGIGKDEYFMASDPVPFIEYTKDVVYLEDEEIALAKRGTKLEIITIKNESIPPSVQKLEMRLEQLEKGGYEHFMLKEIYEQPKSIRDCMRGRLDAKNGTVTLSGIKGHEKKLSQAKRIIIVACGTSWHAGLVGEYLFEELARIPVEVEYASEFRYRSPIINEDDVIIAISQSGETADTLAALDLGKAKGATLLSICNVVGSSIPRACHASEYTYAGPEIGVASTKAFTTQVVVLTLMALKLANEKGTITEERYRELLYSLENIPNQVENMLKTDDQTKHIAEEFKGAKNCLYLGRGYNFPVALEGALKLKEISYIHAEGYPAAEMKHGPIALIDDQMPVVVIATKRGIYEKVVSNIQEVKARHGRIISIITEGDATVKNLSEYFIEIPETEEMLVPLLSTIPLQLLSYHIAVMRGENVDQPRNLAKSVTVE